MPKGKRVVARLRYVPSDFKHARTYRLNNEAIKVLEKWKKVYGERKHPLSLERLVSAAIVSTQLRMIELGLDEIPQHEAERLEAELGI